MELEETEWLGLSFFRLSNAITDHCAPALKVGDIDSCISLSEELMRSIPTTPFHEILSLNIDTCPETTAGLFDRWIVEEEKAGKKLASIYTETNGFGWNTDQWHFHWFAYDEKSSNHDYSYLGNGWISKDRDEIILTGMESIQNVYTEQNDAQKAEYGFAEEVCSCLIIFKFMKFIQTVFGHMKQKTYPFAVSSHGLDVFYELKPDAKSE